jgi:hypothetical protein
LGFTYVELRTAAPVIYTGGGAVREEVLEATLEQLLEQVELPSQALCKTLERQHEDCAVWSMPLRTQAGAWFTELNRRLVQHFYARLLPLPLPLPLALAPAPAA